MRTKGLKIGILSICFMLSGVLPSRAQEPCDDLTSTVDIVYQAFQGQDESAMSTIADTARRARECYGDTRARRRIWLLIKEVWALDGLGRYGEAGGLVEFFFEDLFGDADDLDRGRLYLWRLLYRLYDGDFEAAADAYGEAMRYAEALPLAQQASLRNNGAVLAFRRERFEEAAGETTAGIALLDSTARTRDEAIVLAALLQNRGHAFLEQSGRDSTSTLLDPARRDLHASIALRDSLSITERQAEALVTLGEIYHGLGDDQAGRGYMGTGLRMAREGGNDRGEIFALWRTGRVSRRGGMSRLARQQLEQAFDLSQESGVGEFELFIQLELGRLFEDREAWRRAEDLYRAVAEAPDDARYRSRLFDGARARDEAERRSVAMRMHLAEAASRRLSVLVIGLAFVILLIAGAFAYQWRRTAHLRRRHTLLQNGTPEHDDLFDRRMRYARKIILHPSESALLIDDPALADRVARSGLEHRTQLYEGICALEKAIDKRIVNPKNLGRFLWENFGKRGWTWPDSIEAWHLHFTELPDDANLAGD